MSQMSCMSKDRITSNGSLMMSKVRIPKFLNQYDNERQHLLSQEVLKRSHNQTEVMSSNYVRSQRTSHGMRKFRIRK